MKKILGLLCFVAILAVAYLAVTQSRGGEAPAMEAIESDIVDQVKGMYQEYGAAALEQADEALGDAVEQADEAIGEAVGSAVEGAKKGFLQSLKESVSNFFDELLSENN